MAPSLPQMTKRSLYRGKRQSSAPSGAEKKNYFFPHLKAYIPPHIMASHAKMARSSIPAHAPANLFFSQGFKKLYLSSLSLLSLPSRSHRLCCSVYTLAVVVPGYPSSRDRLSRVLLLLLAEEEKEKKRPQPFVKLRAPFLSLFPFQHNFSLNGVARQSGAHAL